MRAKFHGAIAYISDGAEIPAGVNMQSVQAGLVMLSMDIHEEFGGVVNDKPIEIEPIEVEATFKTDQGRPMLCAVINGLDWELILSTHKDNSCPIPA